MTGKSEGHAVFASNLRTLCAAESSIADICRDTGINRQQFNKYLAGRAIPSATVLRRICQRLGVTEDALLAVPFAPGSAQPDGDGTTVNARLGHLGRDLERIFNVYMPDIKSVTRLENTDFTAGRYHIYFPLSDFAGYLVRAYMEVWWHKHTLMFTRLTRLKQIGKSEVSVRGRHLGVALASKDEISLMGRNRSAPFQVSVINFTSDILSKRFFVGLTMTHAAGKPLACRCVLERLPEAKSRRDGLNSCGVLQVRDEAVPRFVQQVMRPDSLRGPTLQLPDIDHIINSAMLELE